MGEKITVSNLLDSNDFKIKLMVNQKDDEKSKKDKKKGLKPDAETLNTTDPQENMQGPVSSLIQNIKEGAEDGESKEEADERKDRNT